MAFEDIAENCASQKRSVGESEMPRARMPNHSSQWIRTACIMLYKQPWCHTTTMVVRYLVIQMAEMSASGLAGDTVVTLRVNIDPSVKFSFLIKF